MATLVLGIAGRVIGGTVGAPVGSIVGGAIGSIAGGFIDQALFGDALTRASGQEKIEEGPRLSGLKISASSEGAPNQRLYGRMRLPGQLI
jgi:hypothetical protein